MLIFNKLPVELPFLLPERRPLPEIVHALIAAREIPTTEQETECPYDDPRESFFGKVIVTGCRYSDDLRSFVYSGEIRYSGKSLISKSETAQRIKSSSFEMRCTLPEGEIRIDLKPLQ